VPCGEDQAGISPAVSHAVAVSVLLLFANLERGNAQVGQRQRCLGCFGLDLAANELASDSLELLADVQLGVIEVDLIPGQAEDFTPTQAEDEDQHEGRLERSAGMPGRFEEPPGVINGPGLALAPLSRLATP
jgi:hypothetical protein